MKWSLRYRSKYKYNSSPSSSQIGSLNIKLIIISYIIACRISKLAYTFTDNQTYFYTFPTIFPILPCLLHIKQASIPDTGEKTTGKNIVMHLWYIESRKKNNINRRVEEQKSRREKWVLKYMTNK